MYVSFYCMFPLFLIVSCIFFIILYYVYDFIIKYAEGRHNMPRPLQVDLWPFDIESGVRVTCEVAYPYANFSLPRPLWSRLRPDIRDRQDRRQMSDAHHRLMPPPRGPGITTLKRYTFAVANRLVYLCMQCTHTSRREKHLHCVQS